MIPRPSFLWLQMRTILNFFMYVLLPASQLSILGFINLFLKYEIRVCGTSDYFDYMFHHFMSPILTFQEYPAPRLHPREIHRRLLPLTDLAAHPHVCCKVRVAIMRMPRRQPPRPPARPMPRFARRETPPRRARSADRRRRVSSRTAGNAASRRPRLQCVSDRRRGKNVVVVVVEKNERNLLFFRKRRKDR